LAIDILRNGSFNHIFIDAGTGLSAIATILAFAWMKIETLVHVLLLADEEQQFLDKLKRFHQSFEQFVEDRVPWPDRFRLYRPSVARSFGSVNTEMMTHIQFLAREEGFFTDPIYSAKLFLEAKSRIAELSGNVLVVHSGGALTLMGFQNKLARLKTMD
jgi:1-aminocyclopropane-1-carboxylate deaminase/D-cysteine desulfhydrase-like pyridoxal-dependent ACC family enzyme